MTAQPAMVHSCGDGGSMGLRQASCVACTASSAPVRFAGREVPISWLVAEAGGDLERVVHITPERHPMARYVIGFAGCPRWRDPGHRASAGRLMLTLWLSPSTARCSACDYLETLAAWMARMGWTDR